jgi:eukaryotic translation initiation factor 2C
MSSEHHVIGIDVSHPPPKTLKPSVASLVWSYDQRGAKYGAFSEVQGPRDEIVSGLKEMVKKAILKFVSINNAIPSYMLFYRDGVSDGEFSEVGKVEIKAIKGTEHLAH